MKGGERIGQGRNNSGRRQVTVCRPRLKAASGELSIGLTTRFHDLHAVGWKSFWTFTVGVAINVVLGYILSVLVFGSYWAAI